jgi:hypothetical protein
VPRSTARKTLPPEKNEGDGNAAREKQRHCFEVLKEHRAAPALASPRHIPQVKGAIAVEPGLTSRISEEARPVVADGCKQSDRVLFQLSLPQSAAGLAVLALFSTWCPADFYWRWAWPFLSYAWPLLVAAFAARIVVPGLRYHQIYGDGIFLRRGAIVLLVTVFASTWVLTFPDAAGWSLAFTLVVGMLWALANVAVVYGLMAYFEFWRHCERDVQNTILRGISTGNFRKEIEERLAAKHAQPSETRRPCWGSTYILELLESEYDRRMVDVVRQVNATGKPDALPAYVDTAESLVDYLTLDWPTTLMSEQMRIRRLTQTRRQLLTLTIWFARRVGLETLDQARVDKWMNGPCGWNRLTQDDGSPYSRFLRLAFELAMPSGDGREQASGELLPVEKLSPMLNAVMTAFLAVPQNTSAGAHASDRDICAMTWLALTSHVPWRVRFDTWLLMCEQRGVRHRFEDAPRDSEDPAQRCARRALHECYEAWSPDKSGEADRSGEVLGLPSPWGMPIERLAAYAKQASRNFARNSILRRLYPYSKHTLTLSDNARRTAAALLKDDPERDYINGSRERPHD